MVLILEQIRHRYLGLFPGRAGRILSYARATHGSLSPEEKVKMGITDSLVRASVGIEDFKDLRRDFEVALFFV